MGFEVIAHAPISDHFVAAIAVCGRDACLGGLQVTMACPYS
jgi:hypothetical protein